ncbi:hypothetical protein [Bradyrhizobium sp. CCGE-LA001]|uniref:hypothetical protein n=1 Tax=Bradyrhizobium sp. CCGE-LA001 TaxID=1223566 RepID=UPI000745E301|nr:hypothetical protein [Bradyrhizobium sp. CCGE-LA001]AMA59975.1 hypothetical protein BCCGELA001_29505 [Bradyrhizobium sp. CCGE-LA001]
MCRYTWAKKRYPADVERLDRLERAIGDTQRAGQHAISFIDSLTDAKLIAGAEAPKKWPATLQQQQRFEREADGLILPATPRGRSQARWVVLSWVVGQPPAALFKLAMAICRPASS